MVNMDMHEENIKFLRHFGISDISEVSKKRVALVLQEKVQYSYNSQRIFTLSANLLSRLFLNIDFILSSEIDAPMQINGNYQKLNDVVFSYAKKVFPLGNFRLLDDVVDFSRYDGVLVVGYGEGYDNIIFVNSNGWNIHLNKAETGDKYNPIGACAAACFGTAELFKTVMKPAGHRLCGIMSFSLLNYSTDLPAENLNIPESIDIGDIDLIGAGAIASAFVYALNCLDNVRGSLNVVDADFYTAGNLNRYIIADATSVGILKTKNVKQFLQRHNELMVHEHPIVFNAYAKSKTYMETVITAVDKRITRYIIQGALPRLIFDAATTKSFIDLSRVEFGKGGACLGCLYKPDRNDKLIYDYISKYTGIEIDRVVYLYNTNEGVSQSDIDIASKKLGKDLLSYLGQPINSLYAHEYCGSAVIGENDDGKEPVLAPVSFISALAGVLVLSEIIKNKYFPQYKVNNHFHINTFGKPNPMQHMFKYANAGCSYCGDEDIIEAYNEKWSV